MVLQCLIDAIGDTHVSCAEETVRVVHGALQFYQLVRLVASLCISIRLHAVWAPALRTGLYPRP